MTKLSWFERLFKKEPVTKEPEKKAIKRRKKRSKKTDAVKDPAAIDPVYKGKQKSGKARAAKLAPERRKEIARLAVKARWEKHRAKMGETEQPFIIKDKGISYVDPIQRKPYKHHKDREYGKFSALRKRIPYDKMTVGSWIFIPGILTSSDVHGMFKKHYRDHGWKISVRQAKQDGITGVKVWRLK